mmetsp:Transcript_85553/g.195059  ORF Transcript_85553/g.195059 Transcript_85553/m.195059 type:complete len:392 (+) Transcript_85553:106-1281(+)
MERFKGFLPGGKKTREKGSLEELPQDVGRGQNSGRTPRQGGNAQSVNDFIAQTKSRQQQGLKPSGPELIAYARYLSIDVVNDNDLLWIAEEALNAPLPSEWTEHFDQSDRVFYYNSSTHVSSWTHPLEYLYRETYQLIASFRSSSTSHKERQDKLLALQDEAHRLEAEVQQEITAWTEHEDEHGHKFYFNRRLGKSSWTDPRPAKCHILYLKMKTIRLLSQFSGINVMDLAPPGGAGQGFEVGDNGPDSDRKRHKSKGERMKKEPTPRSARQEQQPDPGEVSPTESADMAFGDQRRKKKKKKGKTVPLSGGDPLPAPPTAEEGGRPGMNGMGGGGGGGTLSDVGRARVKPGIKLQPLGAPAKSDMGPPSGPFGGGGLPPVNSGRRPRGLPP